MLLSSIIALMVVFGWVVFCIIKTFEDRTRIFGGRHFIDVVQLMKKVPPEKHLFYRLTFRDPKRLY